MITDMTFKTFCEEHLNDAKKIAINQLAGFKKKSTYWNYKLDDEAIFQCPESRRKRQQGNNRKTTARENWQSS